MHIWLWYRMGWYWSVVLKAQQPDRCWKPKLLYSVREIWNFAVISQLPCQWGEITPLHHVEKVLLSGRLWVTLDWKMMAISLACECLPHPAHKDLAERIISCISKNTAQGSNRNNIKLFCQHCIEISNSTPWSNDVFDIQNVCTVAIHRYIELWISLLRTLIYILSCVTAVTAKCLVSELCRLPWSYHQDIPCLWSSCCGHLLPVLHLQVSCRVVGRWAYM